jgi:UDP-glucose 4-epimerase
VNSDGYILIAGGAGYIGSHINKLFSACGYKAVVFDNLIYGHREFVKWGEFYQGDLADKEAIRNCFKKYPVRAVMHFSAFTYVGESVVNPAKYYINNVVNTINLLEVMREFNVSSLIFSSTCATYGVPDKTPIDESHPQRPVNPYGRSKLMIEQILHDYSAAYGIGHVNLRYFNAAGADPDSEIGEWHDPETHLIPLALDVAAGRSASVGIFGTDYETPDGTCIRDYIHVTDLASAHLMALRYLEDKGQSVSLNLGNGRGFSVREIIETAKRITGIEIKAVESPRRDGDPPILVGSSEKARSLLGWTPRYGDINVIVETAWKWHRKLEDKK